MVTGESGGDEAVSLGELVSQAVGFAQRARRFLIVAAVAMAVLGVALFFTERMNHVYVSDARIGASIVSVSSRVPGWITEFRVATSDRVSKGELLVAIDSRKAQFRLAESEARLLEIRSEGDSGRTRLEMVDLQTHSKCELHKARLAAAVAAFAAAKSGLELTRSEFERVESLLEKGVASRQRWEELRAAHQGALQERERARAGVETAKAALLEAEAGRQQVEVLESQLATLAHLEEQLVVRREQYEAAKSDHEIRSPIGGVVDRTFANGGEYVAPGQRLLMIHDPSEVWVDANVRETEIRHLELGMLAEIKIDAYPGRVFTGEVTRIGDAATSEFALLPSPNPSGNFTKITQRIPIRIALSQSGGLLRPGMMVEVDIDVRRP